MRSLIVLRPVLTVVGINLLFGCSTAHTHAASQQTDIGPVASVQVPLKANGLPEGFFQPGADTKCSSQIIGYRFVVWLNAQNVAVGFNTSPNCRPEPNRKISGVLRILVFDQKGTLKANRDLSYLADGNGELVADGEAMPGPNGTLLVRIESVNLDEEGRHESESGVRLLDVNLKDVAQINRFLEQITFVDHALVFQDGFTLSGPRTYSILDGAGPKEIAHRQVDWPIGAMDRTFGARLRVYAMRSGTPPRRVHKHQRGALRCEISMCSQRAWGGWQSLDCASSGRRDSVNSWTPSRWQRGWSGSRQEEQHWSAHYLEKERAGGGPSLASPSIRRNSRYRNPRSLSLRYISYE
jgi:hypothetical protein